MKIYSLLFVCLLLTGCGYSTTKLENPPTGLTGSNSLNFANVMANVFQANNCLSCHSAAGGNTAGVNLETYASVKANLTRVQAAVNSGRMPPSGPMSAEAKTLLNNWIAAGAPETSGTTPAPGPNPPPPGPGPSPLSFAFVTERTFRPNGCLNCHSSAGGNRAGVNLETYANVRALLPRIQNAVNSGRMPPSRPMPADEKAILNNWIAAGAPELGDGSPPTPPPVTPNPPPCEEDGPAARRGRGDCDLNQT